jgi:predicted GIY-YIG superfamily endonuclease
LVESFTKKYKVDRLLYYEIFRDPDTAAAREKQIKKYRREKKSLYLPRATRIGKIWAKISVGHQEKC